MPYEDFVVVIEDWGLTCSHPCGLVATVGHLRPVSDQLGLVLGHSPKDSCGEAASGGRRVQVRIEDHQRPAAPITAAAINNVVQRRASAAGLENPLGYSAHSLRAGFVTEAKNRGIDEADIMRRYDRTSGLWIRNATTGVSL